MSKKSSQQKGNEFITMLWRAHLIPFFTLKAEKQEQTRTWSSVLSPRWGGFLHPIDDAVGQLQNTTGSHFSSFFIPISPPNGIKLLKKRAWSLSVRHESCWNSIPNTKQSPYLWGERSKQTEQEDFGSHRGYREKEITPLALLLVVNQHFCLSQWFNLPFSGAEHSSQEEFHPGKALKGLVQCKSQMNTKFIWMLTQAQKNIGANCTESNRGRAASSFRSTEGHG